MKSSAKKVELASVDDLFSTEESRADAQREKVLEIPLSELHPFKDHPFKVKDDEAMMETADSVRQYGVLVPAIARPDPEGGYELVAGHRRHRASELAGKETMPVIVRDLDDDAATIIMVDSNLQRESLLPSERAFAYKMKLEAVKHQGARTDLTSRQVGGKLEMADVIGAKAGDSGRQVQRYIRLTELIPELLDMVDEKKIAFNPAYELSFLKKEEQVQLLDAMDSEQATPSLSQAQRLKKFSQEGHLSLDVMRAITEHNLLDYAELAEKAAAATTHHNELSAKIKAAEKRMAEIAVLRTHIINYAKTRETYVAYRKAGYSKKFRQEHEEEILLHQAAKNAFDEMGVKKLPKVKELQAEYAKLLEEKKKTYAEYRRSREEMRELLTAKANVDRLLHRDEEQKKEQEKDHGQR